jgi:hypothetical protein
MVSQFHENSIRGLTTVDNFTSNGHCFAAVAAAASVIGLFSFATRVPLEGSRSYVKVNEKIAIVEPQKPRTMIA